MILALLINTSLYAQTSGHFIEMIQKGLTIDEQTSFTEQIQKQMDTSIEEESFIESVQNENAMHSPQSESSYLKEASRQVRATQQQDIIQTVQAGEDVPVRILDAPHIKYAMGFNFYFSRNQALYYPHQTDTFNSIYKKNDQLGIGAFADYQIMRFKQAASLGVFGQVYLLNARGKGIPVNASNIEGAQEVAQKILFNFLAVPMTFGLSLRVLVLKYITLHGSIGPTLFGYIESRSDHKRPSCNLLVLSGECGNSLGYTKTLGASLLLNWIEAESTTSNYRTFQIQNTYLTIDWSEMRSLKGNLNFLMRNYSLGLTFEF
jgi:hypothetical protein